jgi:hypothetical protein
MVCGKGIRDTGYGIRDTVRRSAAGGSSSSPSEVLFLRVEGYNLNN